VTFNKDYAVVIAVDLTTAVGCEASCCSHDFTAITQEINMKIQTSFKQALATSVLLLAVSQMGLVQAADYIDYRQPQPQEGQSYYVSTDNLTPGYTQPYYQGGYQGNSQGSNYGGGNSMPWSGGRGGNGPGFSGPWDSGNGNSMPWNSGGGGNSMPWSGGRGGNGPSFSGPWNSGNGNSMPWNSGNGNGMSW
jgi:hypothetical protein